jgi:integrase
VTQAASIGPDVFERGEETMKGCRPLSDEEITVVSRSFGGTYAARDRALFILGLKSGFRISELLSLRVGDVLQHGRLVDQVTVRRAHMKQRMEGRTVPLHAEAKHALAAWIDELRDGGRCPATTYLFRSRQGGNRPITRIQAWQILTEAYRTNELTGKLGTHAMRKTFAAKVYTRLQHDLVKTQRALGHRNINSTISYLSFCEDDVIQAILAL